MGDRIRRSRATLSGVEHLLLTCACFPFVTCGDSGRADRITRTDSAGVEVVLDAGDDIPFQIIRDIAFGPYGELWVRRQEPMDGALGPIDVFNPGGAYVGSLPAETPFPVLFLPMAGSAV